MAVVSSNGFRRWLRPQANLVINGARPYYPLPASLAGANMEWGINWCIGARAQRWLAIHAAAVERNGRVFARVKTLLHHADFNLKNPNRARSLIGAMCMGNPAAFHRADAAGYVFWADRVLELDAVNPQLASRIARVMDRWSKLADPYRSAAREAISRVAAKADLSDDVREIVTRALAD